MYLQAKSHDRARASASRNNYIFPVYDLTLCHGANRTLIADARDCTRELFSDSQQCYSACPAAFNLGQIVFCCSTVIASPFSSLEIWPGLIHVIPPSLVETLMKGSLPGFASALKYILIVAEQINHCCIACCIARDINAPFA